MQEGAAVLITWQQALQSAGVGEHDSPLTRACKCAVRKKANTHQQRNAAAAAVAQSRRSNTLYAYALLEIRIFNSICVLSDASFAASDGLFGVVTGKLDSHRACRSK
jgi:hypothetical protein